MDWAQPERTAVLVVRVWLERPEPDGFRARMTVTALDEVDPDVAVAASPAAVLAFVERWLADFVTPA